MFKLKVSRSLIIGLVLEIAKFVEVFNKVKLIFLL